VEVTEDFYKVVKRGSFCNVHLFTDLLVVFLTFGGYRCNLHTKRGIVTEGAAMGGRKGAPALQNQNL